MAEKFELLTPGPLFHVTPLKFMGWIGYIYDFSSILEANLDPDETFIWDPDFPDLLNNRCRHKVNDPQSKWIWKVRIPDSMPIWD